MVTLDDSSRHKPVTRLGRFGRAVRHTPKLGLRAMRQDGKRRFLIALRNTYHSNRINLSLVLGRDRSAWGIRWLSLRALATYIRNGAHYLAPELWSGFELRNPHALDQAMSLGRGVLVACQHLGPQRFAFFEVAARGIEVRAAMSEAFVARASAWLEQMARHAEGSPAAEVIRRVKLLPAVEQPEAAREMVHALRERAAVMFDVDGNTGVGGEEQTLREGLPLKFLGRDIYVRRGIAHLAYRTGAPIVPLVPVWGPGGRPILHFHEPLLPAEGESLEAFAERSMKQLYGLLEQTLREKPEQWEMWPQFSRWFRPPTRLAARREHAEALQRARAHLRELREKSPGEPVRVDRRTAFILRIRGARVLVDTRDARFIVVSPRSVAVLRQLHRGGTLRELVGRLQRRFGEEKVMEELARFKAMGLLQFREREPAASPVTGAVTLVEVLRNRAALQPEATAFTFLTDTGEERHCTYGQLDRRARAIAAGLLRKVSAGDRILLLFPPGLEFIEAFFGVAYARLVAVPCPLPELGRIGRTVPRIRTLVQDAGMAAIMTTASVLPALDEAFASVKGLEVPRLAVEGFEDGLAEAWRMPKASSRDPVLLQYTSGSTSSPKGVIVSHGNLLHNLERLKEAMQYQPGSVAVSWVPHFHDEGLINGILEPVYTGYRCIRMSPLSVVKEPRRWLEAISQYRATHAGGPNFVYGLCTRKVSPEQRQGLDLTCWKLAYNSAEPVRANTLREFVEAFGACGFRASSFFPAFGLAESTLVVTAARYGEGWISKKVDPLALETQGRSLPASEGSSRERVLVSSGRPVADTRVVIVDPERRTSLAPGEVGEVWVSSPSVAQGYWNKPKQTEETFQARLADSGEGPFLRTGDMGFIQDGELFITSRRKDQIIIRGRNVSPSDLELTVERSHPALRPGCGAAFSVEVDEEERLAVVQEVEPGREGETRSILEAIVRSLGEEHELQPFFVGLIEPRTIPKTSSGKLQRHACQEAFRSGTLKLVAQWTAQGRGASARPDKARADALIDWLRAYASERLNSRLMDERRCIPPHVVLDLGNRGFLGLQAPRRYGGLELSTRETLRIFEQLAAIDLTLASFVSGHNVLGIRPIQRYASQAVQAELLPRLAAGRELGSLALTEEGAGANPRVMATAAEPDGEGGWRLRGCKLWSGSSSWAGAINVFARLSHAQTGAEGITGFVVRQGTPGLRFGPEDLTMGLRGMVQNPVYLEDVRVGPDDLLGRPGEGMDVAQDTFCFARLALGALAVGGMKRCAQLMVRYAGRRSIATGRLLDNPVALERLGELTACIAALEALVGRVAEQVDAGRPLSVDASLTCKIVGAESLWKAADDLVQMLGGRGYMETNVAPQLLRDARLFRIFEGPTEALRSFLGSRTANGTASLYGFIAEGLAAPRISEQLRQATEEIRQHFARGPSPADRLRMHDLLGELTARAILWAAAQGGAARGSSERVVEWARGRFESALAQALQPWPATAHTLGSQELEGLVAEYASAIGDIEQSHAGEGRALDTLLRRAPRTEPLEPVLSVPVLPEAPVQEVPPPAAEPRWTRETIQQWLVQWVQQKAGLGEQPIDPREPLASFGMDSVTAVLLVDDLEKWLGRRFKADLAWSYPTVEALSQHLVEQL